MPELKSLLIANRGEIAIRIARAAAELGIETIGIAPRDDGASLHLSHVDRFRTLEGVGAKAYLDLDTIMAIVAEEGCDAVHPGYGFLSENAEFARRCEDAGVRFVGPDSEVLSELGDKAAARTLALSHSVPLLEGTDAGITEADAAAFMASLGDDASIMIKAVSGGGGRGMRVVRTRDDLPQAYAICRSEALAAFGDDAVYAERFVPRARHVEVQILGDNRGGLCHLWDRECSLQRRHQKVIEIAPCVGLPITTRQAMIDAALKMAGAVDYRSLGTFEFLVDADAPGSDAFWFMEANPRIQVEHTVTEEATGIDIVQAQLAIAGGATLSDLGLNDSLPEPAFTAIQARVTMERIEADGSLKPAAGKLSVFEPPTGPGVRTDSFAYAGYHTSTAYDPLLAKVIVKTRGHDFGRAVGKLDRALSEMQIQGVDTNLEFLRRLLAHPQVVEGSFYTRFIEDHAVDLLNAGLAAKRHPAAEVETGAHASSDSDAPSLGSGEIAVAAPMQGMVITVSVKPGDEVVPGQELGLVEAMKMQMAITAPQSGQITFAIAEGSQTEAGGVLFHIAADQKAEALRKAAEAPDPDHIRPELEELQARRATLLDDARPEAVAKRHGLGKRTIRENLAEFFDETRYDEYGSLTIAAQRQRRSIDELIRISPADGMIAAIGQVNSDEFGAQATRCIALAYDYTVLAGTQGINSHKKTDRMLELAGKWRAPVMIFAEGGGGRPGDTDYPGMTGLASMTFRRLAALNGQVPLVGIATGRCFAGNAAMLGCCDVIIATEDSSIGMAGPAMIEGGGLGVVRPEEVGPVSVQGPNGVIDILVKDEAAAMDISRKYLSYFQGRIDDWDAADQRLLRNAIPQDRMRAYDIRSLIGLLCDVNSVLELRAQFAPGIVTALVRIEGHPMGLIANDPRVLGGAIDADCADKTARFLQLCDAFDLPVLSLCDTPGFMVGPAAEKTALVRHVSRMFVAAAGMDVPLVTLVLRKGYGLGAMGMSGGSFHAADATFAWPTGEFGGMGLEGAVRLAYRKELAAVEGKAREALFREYVDKLYEKGKALNIAASLEIDDVIDPAETRSRIVNVLATAEFSRKSCAMRRIDTW
ncbi:carboxyl transferase domain-containing protein [Paracoccus sp. SCSIO 75233]|uniref:acetyl-CoA carboxylase family protein n=1 Tax=Paracoccus sp. SCSIO 75233 TaxID=3017782 RepID=UPI0022EFFD4A|nr:carboxyl transferase domain-containing protein [Paracoccus sp. SCSIO 75233]WBU52977.1 carbamoyl-phosphate synthase large subunit [Paracoccus sp. SCSIO 75233]